MRSSLRNRLLAFFLVLVVVVGAGTLYWIERTLADDLLTALDKRMSDQGRAVASWLTVAGHVDRLTPSLAGITGTRLTVISDAGIVEGDSADASIVGQPIEPAWEVTQARDGKDARAVRQLGPGEPRQYIVAVPAAAGRVIRLAVPLGEIIQTRARMRNRLIVGFGFGLLGALLLSWIFVRAITRPIQSMTHTAETLATGNYDVEAPKAAVEAGGELGVLARTMMYMAGEVKKNIGELTEQRDLLSGVVGGLVEGVVVVDPQGKIEFANAAAKPLIGDSLPPAIVALVAKARDGGEPEEELELVGRTVRASARPLRSTDVIVVLYDITRLRALEAVRRDFLSNAAHELRTPVTSISGYAETLLSGKVDPETSKEFITTIHRNARRMSDMVTDLLVLDQLGGRATRVVGDRGSIALADVVDDAVRTAKGVKPSAQIETEVPPSLLVLATREGLEHVVQNLVDNAVKYGNDTRVAVRAQAIDGRVRVTIEDAGPGIPPGNEERIFERFFRVDAGRSRDQGGSGLGLAIVKSHVEAMGGRVWFEHANPGARFVVELEPA